MAGDLQKRAREGERISASDIVTVRQLADQAIALAPSDPNPYAILGASYSFIGQDAAEGIKAFEKSLQLDLSRDCERRESRDQDQHDGRGDLH